MKKLLVLLLTIGIFMIGCATTNVAPQKTQLQVREFQTRTYDTNDLKMVMKALLNVLQDDGYIIKEANIDLGFLTATKEVDVEKKSEAFWSKFWLGAAARWKKNSVIEATANVSSFGSNQCRVRVNFQMKVLDNMGATKSVQMVEDENHYQDFFAKVDKGVFIQKEGI